jgi:hypothetical protein
VFIDLETRSHCDLKKLGGRAYAQHASTEILSVVAQIDQSVVAWTPLLSTPAGGSTLARRTRAGTPLESFAGPELPAPLAAAVGAGPPVRATTPWASTHTSGEPGTAGASRVGGYPDARAAGAARQLDQVCLRLFGVGKDEEAVRLMPPQPAGPRR